MLTPWRDAGMRKNNTKGENLLIAVTVLLFLLGVVVYFANPYNTASTSIRARVLGFLPYRIPSAAMSPTLMPRDFILVKAYAYASQTPERGDIVVFLYPNNKQVTYIKRVAAVGGDTLAIRDGVVYINGSELDEPYLTGKQLTANYSLNWGEFHVPQDHLFVLGDNRDNSNDSRFWGTVPLKDVVGKATYIWMAEDTSRIGRIK